MTFLSFIQSYSFTYWLPLLLTSFGFDRTTAALGNIYIGFGGIAGVILMLLFVQRVGSARYLAAAFTVGAGFVLLIAFGGLPNRTLPWLLSDRRRVRYRRGGPSGDRCDAVSGCHPHYRRRLVVGDGAHRFNPRPRHRRRVPGPAVARA